MRTQDFGIEGSGAVWGLMELLWKSSNLDASADLDPLGVGIRMWDG